MVTFFAPIAEFSLDGALEHEELVRELNRGAAPGSPICAVLIDGVFELVRARSVARHDPPYPSLSQVAHDQHLFDFNEVEGTVVGFRFPSYAQGIEVAGYHLHFVDAEPRRGGHVLACRTRRPACGWTRHASCTSSSRRASSSARRTPAPAATDRIRRAEGAG